MDERARKWQRKVAALLKAQAEATGHASPPVDLHDIAARCNAKVEEREMIPEALMHPDGDGFRIYLQKNFAHRPGVRLRQRFSLAHEIAHTFFFEMRGGVMKPLRSPVGAALEATCQQAASWLLVPEAFLSVKLSHGVCTSSAEIVDIARQCEASAEVVIRRLQGIGALDSSDFAPVIVRRSGAIERVEYGHHPAWLRPLLPAPAAGADFTAWFSWRRPQTDLEEPFDQGAGEPERIRTSADGTLRRLAAGGELCARPFNVTGSVRIYEIRLRR